MSEQKLTNEWFEQGKFSSCYFNWTQFCRESQYNKDLQRWYRGLESKISLVMAILPDDKRDEVKKARKVLQELYGKYLNKKDSSRKLGGATKDYANATYVLHEALFEVETDIDLEVNKVMPFLNLNEGEGASEW